MNSTRTTPHQAAARRFGINPHQLTRLKTLAALAARAQEQEHNEPNSPDAMPAITAVEEYAESFGFTTLWPGLYPVFTKGGEQYHLPD